MEVKNTTGTSMAPMPASAAPSPGISNIALFPFLRRYSMGTYRQEFPNVSHIFHPNDGILKKKLYLCCRYNIFNALNDERKRQAD